MARKKGIVLPDNPRSIKAISVVRANAYSRGFYDALDALSLSEGLNNGEKATGRRVLEAFQKGFLQELRGEDGNDD